MKKLLFILLFITTNVFANDVTLDPTLPDQTTLTITCNYNLEREDGSPMVVGDIAKVSFFVEKNGVGGFVPAGENIAACQQVYDMSQVPDGVYIYRVTETDTAGRESILSTGLVTATVKRLPNPSSPTAVSGSVS